MSIFARLSHRVPPATEAILVRIEGLMDEQRNLLEQLRDELDEASDEEGDHGG